MSAAFAFVFDLDGVVADTVEPHYRSWQRLADEEGLPFDRAANAALLGRERLDALKVLAGDRELAPDVASAWAERKQRYFLEELEHFGPADLLPGVADLLAEARSLGVPLGLASSSRNARLVLERTGLARAFDAVADGTTVARAKPAPDIFVWTAGRLGVVPARAVVFEDAPAGVAAALAGGFPVVGLGPEAHGASRLRPDLRGATVAEFALPWATV